MDLPKRKSNRLKNYDYSQPNAYFITICRKNREQIFWENVGASIARPEDARLSAYGKVVEPLFWKSLFIMMRLRLIVW